MEKDYSNEGEHVDNPMFPDIRVAVAQNSKGQTAIVLTLTENQKTINAMLSLNMALDIGKAMMACALHEMNEDQLAAIEDEGDVIVMRAGLNS